MTFTDAAAEVLRLVGRPLHYKEITDIAIEKNLLSHVGKSPEVTMGARLAATLKKDSPENPLVRVKPGVFALREWDDKTIKAGLEGKKGKKGAKDALGRGRGRDADGEAAAGAEVEEDEALAADAEDMPNDEEMVFATDVIAPAHGASMGRPEAPAAHALGMGALPFRDEEEEDREPAAPDEAMRAEAAAGAAEMFDEEDDDDQPILGGNDDRASAPGAEQGEGRRRRRRRRRGRSGNGEAAPNGGGLPSYTATPAFDVRRD